MAKVAGQAGKVAKMWGLGDNVFKMADEKLQGLRRQRTDRFIKLLSLKSFYSRTHSIERKAIFIPRTVKPPFPYNSQTAAPGFSSGPPAMQCRSDWVRVW